MRTSLTCSAFLAILSLAGLPSAPAQNLYWTAPYELQRADVNGVNDPNGASVETLATGLAFGHQVQIDANAGKVYWADGGAGSIHRADRDGSNPETLVSGEPDPIGLWLELGAGKMYWTDGVARAIKRANLDGSNIEVVLDGLGYFPWGLVVDPIAGRIYFTQAGDFGTGSPPGLILRCDQDGSNVVTLLDVGTARPLGLRIHGGYMYWAEWSAGKIRRAKLDGSGAVDIIMGISHVFDLAIDTVDAKLYWTQESGTIKRANLDGSTIETVVSGIPIPIGIAIEPPVTGRVAHWRFDEPSGTVAVDAIGGHDGDVYGAIISSDVPPSPPGPCDNPRSREFADSYSYVVVPDHDDLDLTGSFTLEAWVHPALSPGSMVLCKHYDAINNDKSWTMELETSGVIRFHGIPAPGSGTIRIDSLGAVTPNVWSHIAMTYDQATDQYAYYINGQPAGSGTANLYGALANTDWPLYIGAHQAYEWDTFEGAIDDVQIWNEYRTAAQINEDMGDNFCNQAPVADAGPEQTVDELTLVTLDGSGSSDPDSDPLTYTWTQLAGTTVILDLTDLVYPTFTAPMVAVGGETLTFQVIVNDGEIDSAPDVVNITVKNVNGVPVADAGADQSVAEGSPVSLDALGSYDPDGEAITYDWLQIGGPIVSVTDPNTATASFTAPFVGPTGETLTFELTVSDGIDASTDEVSILVENVNHDPIANAGADQTKDENTVVTLNGSGSDPDGDSLTFDWVQLSGPSVTLSDEQAVDPSFTAPNLFGVMSETLVFELTVDDGYGGIATDQVAITVLDTNAPPACELAQPNIGALWPPNHKMHAISIVGVTDPENDGVQIAILDVTQDEPVDGLGDGDTSPDAVIQGDTVLIRAERAGGGNGRVYHILFEANDGVGGICTGTVTVCVPHNKKVSCVDDGPSYGNGM